MKRFAILALTFVFTLSLALPNGTVFAKSDALKFVVDGVEVKGYEQPFMSHGQVLLPVEDLFNEAGFKVTKDKSRKINVTNTHLSVDFNPAAGSIEVDGKKVQTEFPLTLKNAGNYVSGEFLSTLEGFDVEVSEDKKTVNVTTNRVQDVDAFFEKMLAADLQSYSSKITLDQKVESLSELGSIDMLMDIEMDITQEPIAMYMLSKMTMNLEGEKTEEVSETYFTKEGFFQQTGDKWVKFDDSMTESLLQTSIAQADPLAQLELMKKFTKGIHIFEYEDVYVMTQTLTSEEFGEMMQEAMSLLTGLLPEELTGSSTEDVPVLDENEEGLVEVEDVSVDETEDAIEEKAVEEEGIEDIFEDLAIHIEEYYTVTVIDKKTLFPIETSGTTLMTLGVDEEMVSIKQLISGTYSNYNAVKEIKIPADVIKNAITMEAYMKELEVEFEKAEALMK